MGRYLARTPLQAIYTSPLQRARRPPVDPGAADASGAGSGATPAGEAASPTTPGSSAQGHSLEAAQVVLAHDLAGSGPRRREPRTMHQRVQAVITEGLRQHRGEAFVCISHGDPIQASGPSPEGRRHGAAPAPMCQRGLLKLTYHGDRLAEKIYLSPDAVAAASIRASEPLPLIDPDQPETDSRPVLGAATRLRSGRRFFRPARRPQPEQTPRIGSKWRSATLSLSGMMELSVI